MAITILIYIFFFTIVFSLSFPRNTLMNNRYFSKLNVIFLSLISISVIYITDIYYTDRKAYTSFFKTTDFMNFNQLFNSTDMEPLFVIFTYLASALTDNVIVYYILIHIIFLFVLKKGLLKISGYYFVCYVLLLYLNIFFYYGYTLNGLRQGLAISLIVLVIGYALKNEKLKFSITSVISIFFHYSVLPMIILVLILMEFTKYLKIKYLVFFYFIISLLYIFDLQQVVIGFLDFEYLITYTSDGVLERYGQVNNLDFLIFNTFFLVLFIYIYQKFFKKDSIYIFILKCYILFSSLFLLFGFIAYADRIAAYSWFLIPILLAYFMDKKTNSYLTGIILLLVIVLGIFTGIPDYFISEPK